MKNLYIICILVFNFVQADAQTIATTRDGREVILYGNGSWRYADRNNSLHGSTDAEALYNEAYKYAYDVVFEPEFSFIERSEKATVWAKEYVSKNLYLPVGLQTLEQWFDDLSVFADEYLFKKIFFGPERKKAIVAWVEQVMKDKAYFEDHSLSIIARHRMAYDLAYERIYKDEFFHDDRKKKAVRWANDFIRR